MIHKIKAMYDEGRGCSMREIARQLKISRNTVRKYLRMETEEIQQTRAENHPSKVLDPHRASILHLLQTFPRLSAVKVKRKLEEKLGPLDISSRSFRRYINALRPEVVEAQPRYYEPVLDDLPGLQCQVDPGELREVEIAGVLTTVYFVVFVLSYSRLMYVGTSRRPIDTETFIGLHDAAFRAFGSCPEECVYDQTKLVVLHEQHRELTLNQRFAQYATAAGFRIRACEGYDPESKGKVEAGVKYVKQDALYGEQFESWSAMEHHLQQWLSEVANVRIHGTTGQIPQDHYDQHERSKMRPYLSPTMVTDATPLGESRQVDKTGLISFRSNKYSVPMAWQRQQVRVWASPEGELHIYAPQDGTLIATHLLSPGKGGIIKNGDHYRDKTQYVATMEAEIEQALPAPVARQIMEQLRRTDPSQYRYKLSGLRRQLQRISQLPPSQLERLADKEGLTITSLLEYLAAWEAAPERMTHAHMESPAPTSSQGSGLAHYRALTQPGTEQGEAHELH